MKTRTLLFNAVICAALCFTAMIEAQTIWRVNNQSNYDGVTLFGDDYGGTPSFPVFKEINEAVQYASVMDGDTLHVEGSPTLYSSATINKQLTIIGPGYFLTENENVSNDTYEAEILSITFGAGSEFSQIIGMNIASSSSSTSGRINVNANGVTIKRCFISREINFTSGLNDVYILQNFFPDSNSDNAFRISSSSTFVAPMEVVFNNNICKKKLLWSDGDGVAEIMECNNNVFDSPATGELNLQFNTGSFQNNIVKTPGAAANINSGTNQNVQYNTVSNNGLFSGTTGNLWVPNMNDLFVENGTSDGVYQLQEGVTSNVPGSDGADRGAFGGVAVTNRYNLSGLGAIPVVYEVTTTGVSEPETGLPVTIRARTNN